jgi:uncharacterized protein DUF6252
MSATIDFAPWRVDSTSSSGALAAALFSGGALALDGSAYRRRCPCRVILVYVQQITAGGRYRLGDTTSTAFAGYQFTDSTYTHRLAFTTSRLHGGELAVASLDTVRHLVTGTFFFDAGQNSGSTVIHIREGKFRVIYP